MHLNGVNLVVVHYCEYCQLIILVNFDSNKHQLHHIRLEIASLVIADIIYLTIFQNR